MNIFKKLLFRLLLDFSAVIIISGFVYYPIHSTHIELAIAEAAEVPQVEAVVAESSVYTKTFTITAYYSPLPCQDRYVTGSFEGDKRLNGNGTNGADGTPVYPGMIAAPKTYAFGTKMFIPGIGVTAVHDRGGAIVASGTPGVHDRLDIWMGFGDKGLNRALQWGKRSVDVTVYGVTNSVSEEISLFGFSSSESIPNSCSPVATVVDTRPTAAEVEDVVIDAVVDKEIDLKSETSFSEPGVVVPAVDDSASRVYDQDLQKGDSGNEVRELQEELVSLNYYRGDITGYYGDLTEHAVFKFQQSQSLVGDKTSGGAGIFGSKTRNRMNEILSSRQYVNSIVIRGAGTPAASAELDSGKVGFPFSDGFGADAELEGDDSMYLVSELDPGVIDPQVSKLQAFLKDGGYFTSPFFTDYFGPLTKDAVLKFQLENGIISSESDLGAGRIGPATLKLINSLV